MRIEQKGSIFAAFVGFHFIQECALRAQNAETEIFIGNKMYGFASRMQERRLV